MKKIFKTTIALFALSPFLFTACDSNYAGADLDAIKVSSPAGNTSNRINPNNLNQAIEAFGDFRAEDSCEYSSRQTVATIQNEVGQVVLLMPESEKFVIMMNGGNKRYAACNLPAELMRNGISIRFSGEIKEIMTNERLMATPFVLQDYQVITRSGTGNTRVPVGNIKR